MKRWIVLGVMALSLALPPVAAAQASIQVLDQKVDAVFRDHITFSVSLQSPSPITDVRLLYKVAGFPATNRGEATFQPGAWLEASFNLDQTKNYLPPGSSISYYWQITNQGGDTLKTTAQTYVYMDDRHPWQKLSNDRLALYWYVGGDALGKALFDQANKTLDQIEQEAGVQVTAPAQIFIYGSHDDLMNAIAMGNTEWTGGQTFPEQGIVVIGVSPDQLEFGLIAVPHELTHLVIHHATQNPYNDLPRWLDEGLAVYMSGELDAPWRGYRQLVASLVQMNQLMTLQTLSSSFPADPNQALQAYAQSATVVEFIIKHYGSQAMANLLKAFAEGNTYDDALKQALGVDTWGLDNAWRQSVGAPQIQVPGQAQPNSSGARWASPAGSLIDGMAAAGTPLSTDHSTGLIGLGMPVIHGSRLSNGESCNPLNPFS